MVKATITFNLSDEDDETEMRQYFKADDLVFAWSDLASHLRSQMKYEELSDIEYACTEKIQSKIMELFEKYSIDLDELSR